MNRHSDSQKFMAVCRSQPLRHSETLQRRVILRRNLFEGHRRIFEHSRFNVAARSKDMTLPFGSQRNEAFQPIQPSVLGRFAFDSSEKIWPSQFSTVAGSK